MNLISIRPPRLTTSSAQSDHTEKRGALSMLTSPISLKSPIGRFAFFGRKRTSTSTTTTNRSNGSVTIIGDKKEGVDVFHTFQKDGEEEEEFEFSRDQDGSIRTLPRPSALTAVPNENSFRLENGPELMKLTISPTGAPVYIGSASLPEDPTSKPPLTPKQIRSRASIMQEVHRQICDQDAHHFKQSCQSRHKIPTVVKKLIDADEPKEFDWASVNPVINESDDSLEPQEVEIPPPPPLPSSSE